MSPTAPDRPQTLGEEIANAVSHGLGLMLAVAALPILVVTAVRHGNATSIASVAVFAATAILLYGISMLYHAIPRGRAKAWLLRLDHAAIYVFIAGSYTPFALGVLRDAGGLALFAVVWLLAVAGVSVKLLDRLKHPLWSTGLYVGMGWLALLVAVPLLHRLSGGVLGLLVAGGLAYTAGAVVFLFDNRLRYCHFVWHLFVLAGSVCHFFAALLQTMRG